LSVLGFDHTLATELVQGGLAVDGLDVDAATIATVTAVCGSIGNEFLAEEGDAAVTA
jgi:hypothetical protein